MAELVGSALLSAFFSALFDKLATEEVKNFLRPKKVIKKLLKKLDVLRWSADELLDDAEEKLIYNQRVENWHNELKDVVYKASELADKIETEALRRQYASNMTKMFKKLSSNPLNSFDNYVKKSWRRSFLHWKIFCLKRTRLVSNLLGEATTQVSKPEFLRDLVPLLLQMSLPFVEGKI